MDTLIAQIDFLLEHLLVENWAATKKFFNVRSPLFHGTYGPRVTSILRDGFLRSGKQVGISAARTLQPLLIPGAMFSSPFGTYVLVLDGEAIEKRYKVSPVHYPEVDTEIKKQSPYGGSQWFDEQEERIYTDKLPIKYIKGIIILGDPEGDLDELARKFPVVYKSKSEWIQVQPPEETE